MKLYDVDASGKLPTGWLAGRRWRISKLDGAVDLCQKVWSNKQPAFHAESTWALPVLEMAPG